MGIGCIAAHPLASVRVAAARGAQLSLEFRGPLGHVPCSGRAQHVRESIAFARPHSLQAVSNGAASLDLGGVSHAIRIDVYTRTDSAARIYCGFSRPSAGNLALRYG